MCVLLIENDLVLQITMVAAFRRVGHEVEEASHGREALDVFDQQPERFTILVTNTRLPGHLDGRRVAEHVHARCPDLPIVAKAPWIPIMPLGPTKQTSCFFRSHTGLTICAG